MAVPTQPTSDSIVTEALKRAGYSNPSAAKISRAKDWLEEVKHDIWTTSKKWKSLIYTSYGVTTKGISRYANPVDFERDLTLTILTGDHTGTLQAATSSSATLDANEDVSEDFAIGKLLLITSGTGLGACSQITAYNTTTKVASVTPDFTVTPDGTETYMIVDTQYPLHQLRITERDAIAHPNARSRPTHYFPLGMAQADSDETGEFELYPTPDKLYGLQMRYYANLSLVDLSSNLMGTLYRRWRNVFITGVYWRVLQDDDDDRYLKERTIYRVMLQELKMREVDGMNLDNLQCRVVDYY